MNEEKEQITENRFSLDMQTEIQAMTPLIEPDPLLPSDIINILPSIELSESVPFTATEIKIGSAAKAQFAEISGLDYSVTDTEMLTKQFSGMETKIKELQGGFQDLYNNAKNPNLPNSETDDFEERPTTEPRNLIFDERRTKMSAPPSWA
jgi:hypothetical protein